MSNKKNIFIFSTHDFGGAGESAVRINNALNSIGYNSVLLVRHKTKNDKSIIKINHKDVVVSTPLYKKIYNKIKKQLKNIVKVKNQYNYQKLETNADYCFFGVDEKVSYISLDDVLQCMPFNPDLILVCWISDFINIRIVSELAILTSANAYLLTTDMAPLTGGCHYAWECEGYKKNCNDCPAIITTSLKQLAAENLSLKRKHINISNINVLAGSEWCRLQAKQSSLFKNQKNILVLNGVIDKNIFNDRCRDIAKRIFNVPSTCKIIFTGATFTDERRKGIQYMVESLNIMYLHMDEADRRNTKILIAGNNLLDNKFARQIMFDIIPFDFIKDERLLSLAYQSSDLYVCSSIEDSGPMMVNEALACGTPVVGFNLGFVADIVQDGVNGYRIPLIDVELMAKRMQHVLSFDSITFELFSKNAVKAIDDKVSITSLHNLFKEIL